MTNSGSSEKQAAQSWGAAEGTAELKDEEAGAEIAKKEQKEVAEPKEVKPDPEAEAEAARLEAEEKQIGYEAYLVLLAEKKLALGSTPEIRQANEGSKADKKWAGAKPLPKVEEEAFMAASSSGKARRERERKVKTVIDVDPRIVEPSGSGGRGGDRGDRGGRGGRGGGDRGRGAPRGGRGDGAPRGDRGASRGGERGGPRGGAPRGAPRGGAPASAPRGGGPKGATINTSDQQAFPSLGK
ncbi:hypothetical protein IMZ48_09605 [Candidatus Bathyarchaeota archaeon]|nr:hypothetical protein [Candidatus Bathyarchaeota archaeon]